MKIQQQSNLYFREGSSDKVYNCQISEEDGKYSVAFQYGRRGSTLVSGSKGQDLTEPEAIKIYTKLVNDKLSKGYRAHGSTQGHGVAYQPIQDPIQTDFRPQLLNSIEEESDLDPFFNDDSYIMSEKKDGKRITIKKDGVQTIAINRKGKIVSIPQIVIDEINKIPRNITVDGELIGDTYYAFDILKWGETDVSKNGFGQRLAGLCQVASAAHWGLDGLVGCTKPIQLVSGFQKEDDKRSVFAAGKERKVEGFVFKKANAPYAPGRPHSGGSQHKYKFTATATCLVGSQNGSKRSVSLSVCNAGSMHLIGNVTIPSNFPIPNKGDLVEIRYLHCFPNGSLYQPVYLGVRDDKDIVDSYDSLKFKEVSSDEDDDA